MNALLSVDWDYFFPEGRGTGAPDALALWDWGMTDTQLGTSNAVWVPRAAAFVAAEQELPKTDRRLARTFWSRFRFTKGATLYVAESHAAIAHRAVLKGINEIWSYDAHHDCGYVPLDDVMGREHQAERLAQGKVRCDDWGLYASQYHRPPILPVIRYPEWKTEWPNDNPPRWAQYAQDGPTFEQTPTFRRVFICRSGAWVPPWEDQAFLDFVAGCPLPIHDVLTPAGWPDPMWAREWGATEEARAAELADEVAQMGGRL